MAREQEDKAGLRGGSSRAAVIHHSRDTDMADVSTVAQGLAASLH